MNRINNFKNFVRKNIGRMKVIVGQNDLHYITFIFIKEVILCKSTILTINHPLEQLN